jgi:hypothetical protein
MKFPWFYDKKAVVFVTLTSKTVEGIHFEGGTLGTLRGGRPA